MALRPSPVPPNHSYACPQKISNSKSSLLNTCQSSPAARPAQPRFSRQGGNTPGFGPPFRSVLVPSKHRLPSNQRSSCACRVFVAFHLVILSSSHAGTSHLHLLISSPSSHASCTSLPHKSGSSPKTRARTCIPLHNERAPTHRSSRSGTVQYVSNADLMVAQLSLEASRESSITSLQSPPAWPQAGAGDEGLLSFGPHQVCSAMRVHTITGQLASILLHAVPYPLSSGPSSYTVCYTLQVLVSSLLTALIPTSTNYILPSTQPLPQGATALVSLFLTSPLSCSDQPFSVQKRPGKIRRASERVRKKEREKKTRNKQTSRING